MPNSDLFVDEFYQSKRKDNFYFYYAKGKKKIKKKENSISYETNNALIRKPDTHSMKKKNYISRLSDEHKTRNLKQKY